jgi:hypothetical protein
MKIRNAVKLTVSAVKHRESVSFEGLSMSEERSAGRGPELGRWLLVGALLIIGLVLYFVYAPDSTPPAPPAAHEER